MIVGQIGKQIIATGNLKDFQIKNPGMVSDPSELIKVELYKPEFKDFQQNREILAMNFVQDVRDLPNLKSIPESSYEFQSLLDKTIKKFKENLDLIKVLDDTSEFSLADSIDTRQTAKSMDTKANSRNYSNPYSNDFHSFRAEHENKQNLINGFIKETGEDEKTAAFFIDSSSNDLNSAIQLYKLSKENN